MSAAMSQFVLPGNIKIVSQKSEPAVRKFVIEETEPHTDAALLNYCGANSYLWGRVERMAGQTTVVVYTD